MPRLLHPEEYDTSERSSSDSTELIDLNSADFESQGLTTSSYVHRRQPSSSLTFIKNLPLLVNGAWRRHGFQPRGLRRPRRSPSSCWHLFRRRIPLVFHCLLGTILALVLITVIFRPSYTKRPAHYDALKKIILASKVSGRGNPAKEQVFIATSIYDKSGHLVDGAWGSALLNLVDLLGKENVFLSIYENDAGQKAEDALSNFKARVPCVNEIIFERHLPLNTVPKVVMPDGSERTKRIAYLAEVRNRALRPLRTKEAVRYDKLLFLNDVVFDPIEAVQLLFSTNTDGHGKSSYLAACAVDFINPFKFYDTFATRDAEGYSMGVPFFPWFSDAGEGISRSDVVHGKDAVRVKSCWGGMVAFDATFFQAPAAAHERLIRSESNATQPTMTVSQVPIRFRAEADLYWEASECCLVHADLLSVSEAEQKPGMDDVGIYMNPYIRVAYGTWTLWWLRFTRRMEKLYIIPHYLVNHLAGLPRFNPRRTEIAGQPVTDRVWVTEEGSATGGSFQEVGRVAGTGGYCGFRTLQLIKDSVRKGEKNWETMPVPAGE
ncbi:MAG: hypothetical protein L6R42_003084 [Xanthoria sp. 1 TBL-2021]|nr:MAG: hypothetical protein L6R42_003084 [Xanthoria sp. 1 TBL-2021]